MSSGTYKAAKTFLLEALYECADKSALDAIGLQQHQGALHGDSFFDRSVCGSSWFTFSAMCIRS